MESVLVISFYKRSKILNRNINIISYALINFSSNILVTFIDKKNNAITVLSLGIAEMFEIN